jgi:hypothetical protein
VVEGHEDHDKATQQVDRFNTGGAAGQWNGGSRSGTGNHRRQVVKKSGAKLPVQTASGQPGSCFFEKIYGCSTRQLIFTNLPAIHVVIPSAAS